MTARRYSQEYPGECPAKSAMRAWQFGHLVGATRGGTLLSLAGPEPWHELEMISTGLRWPKNRVVFVDWSAKRGVLEALDRLRRLGYRAENDDVRRVLWAEPCVSVAILDLMGGLDVVNEEIVRSTASRLLPGGIMTLTWLRGREHVGGAAYRAWKTLGRGDRTKGVRALVHEWSEGRLEFLGSYDYQNNHSPLTVGVWKKR